MTASHFAGPIVTFGISNSATQGTNPEAGPSASYQGYALLDPRTAYGPGLTGTGRVPAFALTSPICVIDQVPSTLATANIAALANVVSGTAMTLVAASGAGITISSSVWSTANNAALSGVTARAIDTAYTPLTAGSANLFDPTKAISRCISITAAASATGGDFIVRGYDVFGVAMAETITAAAGASTTNGVKAFKYVTSVTPQFSDAHNYSIGTADVYGLPLRSDAFEFADIYWAGALITASTGYTAAVTTSPATAVTGDVRGTYATQSASNNTRRLVVFLLPRIAAVTTATPTTSTTLFGVTQFTV